MTCRALQTAPAVLHIHQSWEICKQGCPFVSVNDGVEMPFRIIIGLIHPITHKCQSLWGVRNQDGRRTPLAFRDFVESQSLIFLYFNCVIICFLSYNTYILQLAHVCLMPSRLIQYFHQQHKDIILNARQYRIYITTINIISSLYFVCLLLCNEF